MSLKSVIINIRHNVILGFILFTCLCYSCKQELTFQEKICEKYIGKEIVFPSEDFLINKDCNKTSDESYKLLHIIELTCCSCVEELKAYIEYIKLLKRQKVSFELVGYSSFKETEFSPVLLQYPLYFDFNRNFGYLNSLKNDDITRTFLIKGNKIVAVGNLNNRKFRKSVLLLVNRKS